MVVPEDFIALSAPAISEQLCESKHKWRTFPCKSREYQTDGMERTYEEEILNKKTRSAGNIPVKGKEYPVGTGFHDRREQRTASRRYTEGTLIDQMDKKDLERLRQELISLINSF